MRVISWNVLHRVHAENWAEPCIGAFPDERERLERIAAKVAAWVRDGVDAVCLQEVSGDQLALLARLGLAVTSHAYARVPRLRVEVEAAARLVDASEHLAVVAAVSTSMVASASFDNDGGKGFLAVRVGGVPAAPLLVCTHVSAHAAGAPQLARLADVARAPAMIVGDFNATADVVAAGLGAGFVVAESGGAPTRVATPQYPDGKVIDHAVARGVTIVRARVLDDDDELSDHRPVEVVLGA